MVLDLFAGSDICSLTLLLGVLVVIGNYVVQGNPALRSIGLRIGFAAFVVGTAAEYWQFGPSDASTWLGVILRALLIGAFAAAVSWILLPLFAFLYTYGITGVFRAIQDRRAEKQRVKELRSCQRQDEEKRRRAAEEWERGAPEREAARREAETKSHATQKERKRREKARVDCEVLYALHAPDIGERFPRADFDRFFRSYMTDSHAVKEVEERSKELQRIIESHRVARQPRTIEELAKWYVGERQRIEALPLDDDLKQTHLVQLDERYMELSQSLLNKAQP